MLQNNATYAEYITNYINFARSYITWRDRHLDSHIKQLLNACADGNLQVVAWLLNQGWSTETATKNKYTLLLIASAHGQADVVKLLLSRGANIHARQKNHLTSLQLAQARRHEEVERILHDHLAKESGELQESTV